MPRENAHDQGERQGDAAPGAASDATAAEEPHDEPFPYRDYTAAREAIRRAVLAGPSYSLLTGPSGSGKSSVARELAASLERPRHQVLYLSSSRISVLGLVNCLGQALRISPKRSSLETAQVVAQALRAQTTRYVLWVDEADQVAEDTLSEIRILAESDLEAPQLLSIVLSGLPELRAVLDARELFPLKRRIALRCALTGLARDEIDPFLVHRLGGGAARRLPPALGDDLFERTEGIPAQVEKVVRIALERTGHGPIGDAALREAFDAAGV
jgi:type II secretory pathway predicted ATPase ExeA